MKRGEMLLKLQKSLEILVKRKVSYLNLRIETIKSKMQMLSDKDIVRDVISSSKGLFNYLRRAN